jgi:hypothetical protein
MTVDVLDIDAAAPSEYEPALRPSLPMGTLIDIMHWTHTEAFKSRIGSGSGSLEDALRVEQ